MIGKGVFDVVVRFADIDGNGLADFLCIEPDGRTWGYLNSNGGTTLTYISQFKKSEGKDRANLHYGDVNGDGRADLLWKDKFNGDTQVWYNRGPAPSSGSAFTWDLQGTLYQGAAQGNCIMYPDLDGNSRADMHVIDSLTNTAETWFNDCGNGGGDDSNTLTIAAVQPGPEVLREVEAFLAAYHDSGYDGDDVDDVEAVMLASALTGYEECSEGQKKKIYSGWQQSWTLMDFIRPQISNLDWNSAAAIEYLGPPSIISPEFNRFKEIMSNLVTFKSAWWARWFGYKINVRCDDPSNQCPCGTGPTIAYTKQIIGDNIKAMINFCPRYFNYDTLQERIDDANADGNLPIQYANMDNYYQNQAYVWIHELLHNDDVSKATDDPDEKRLLDLVIWLGGKVLRAYGPKRAKGLARFAQFKYASKTHRNVDNIGLYILAKYVQEKVLNNVYPHLPIALPPPDRVFLPPSLVFADIAVFYRNGTVVPLNAQSEDDTCGLSDPATVTVSPIYDDMITRDKYPTSYVAQYDGWAGL